jgi:hypothetical protein
MRASISEFTPLLKRNPPVRLAIPFTGRVTGSVSAAGCVSGLVSADVPVPAGVSLASSFLIEAIMRGLAFKAGGSLEIASRRIAEISGG